MDFISRPKKEAKIKHNTITFVDEKARGIRQTKDNNMIISIILAKRKVYRVLTDNRSSADILYVNAFDRTEIGREKLKPTCTPLICISGEFLIHLGSIKLPLTIGIPLYQGTKMVNFLVVERPSIYNVILGKPALNMF